MLAMLAAGAWYYIPVNQHILDRSHGFSGKPESFVGMEQKSEKLVKSLDYSTSDTRIVSIVGGPGIGKSALAKSAAHEMLSRVYYVDMTEVTSMQALAERVLEGDEGIVTINPNNITIKKMYEWARQQNQYTLLLLDNCDDMMNRQHGREELQSVVNKLFRSSKYLKILTTSRQRTMRFSEFRQEWLPLNELDVNASCTLIRSYSPELTDRQCQEIGDLTGNIPLALKVVGSLLTQPTPPDPDIIIDSLKKVLIPTLSSKNLPVDERVDTRIGISYDYLGDDVKKVGNCLARYFITVSFTLDTAIKICSSSELKFMDTESAINDLVERSLLQKDRLTCSSRACSRKLSYLYQFNPLIKAFFLQVDGPDSTLIFIIDFVHHFAMRSLEVVINSFDQERHNLVQKPTYVDKFSFLGRQAGVLQYRFTIDELRCPNLAMVEYLQTQCWNMHDSNKRFVPATVAFVI